MIKVKDYTTRYLLYGPGADSFNVPVENTSKDILTANCTAPARLKVQKWCVASMPNNAVSGKTPTTCLNGDLIQKR